MLCSDFRRGGVCVDDRRAGAWRVVRTFDTDWLGYGVVVHARQFVDGIFRAAQGLFIIPLFQGLGTRRPFV
jgi:hypothetical protein